MKFGELNPAIRLRIGVGFVQRFLNVMLMPLMVILLSQEYGLTVAGALTAVVATAAVASSFVGGHLADHYGRRSVLLAGEIGSAVTFALLAAVNSPRWQSTAITFVLYLLNNCISSAAVPANDAMLIDVSTPENRTFMYSVNYWSINVSFTLGALVGGFLYNDYFFLLLVGATVLGTGIAVVTALKLPETAPPVNVRERRSRGPRAMLRDYRNVARDRVFARLLVAATLVRSIEVQISYYIAVRLADEFPVQTLLRRGDWQWRVGGVEMLGIIRAVNTALVVCLALFAVRLFRRLSDRTRLYGGLALFTGGYMVWAVSDSGWILIVAAVLLTIGEVVNVPVKQALLADLVDPAARTKYMAAYGLNNRIGLIIGSVCVTLGGWIGSIGMAVLYGVAGACAIVAFRSLLRVRAARATPAETV